MAGWSSAAAGAPAATAALARAIPQSLTRARHHYERLDTMEPTPHAGPSSSEPSIEAAETVHAGLEAAPGRAVAIGRRDKAAELLDSATVRVTLTAVDNRRLLRKIDMVILPILLTVYFLQSLDKATLAYAAVFGLITDTNLQDEEYSWLGSIVYVAQLVMQPLVAVFLVKLPIGKFTGAVVLGWGIVLCCMALAHNFSGLLATRFFLGAMEASVAPAFVAITQMWWRRAEQTNRVAAWYAMNGVTNMASLKYPDEKRGFPDESQFGSLLSYGLGHIQSRLKSYQIIFLFCGLLTVVVSFAIFAILPDSPVEAKFLNENDKLIAIERLRMNQMGVVSRTWKWNHLEESILDLKTWFWFALIFSISVPSGGISNFGPLIVKSFGFDSFTAILFNIPFGAVQIIATMGGAFLASRIRMKGPVLILLCIPPIIGCSILMAIDHVHGSKAALLIGYYLISVYPGITPLIYSWSAQNTAGDTKRKCTTGFLFIGQSAGNIVGPHLYNTNESPGYTRGLVSNLSLYIAIVAVVILTTLYLHSLNCKHAILRESLGKSAIVVDTSMLAVKDDDPDAITTTERLEEGVPVQVDMDKLVGDKAFDDETDLKNEDFIFVY